MGAESGDIAVERDAPALRQRLDPLSDTVRAFAEATHDLPTLFEAVVTRTARALGGSCSFSLVSGDGQWLVPAAFFAADPSKHAILQQLSTTAPMPIDAPHPMTRSL